jgi:hypothetical protein
LPDENREKERRNAWELMRTALLDMNRTAAASGARFAVILIPSKEEVYWDVVRQDLSAGAPADVDRPLGMVEGFCREQQIPVCDLRPVFQSQAKEYRQLYLRVSGHWNDAGNDLAATTIARCLASQGLVPPPHAIDPLARSARDR